MKSNWKHSSAACALSVAMLASFSGQMAQAKPVETGQKLIKDKPVPPSVEKGKSATIPVEVPTVADPATERGHLCDPHPSCTKIISEREAAPPPVNGGAAPQSTARPKKKSRPKERDDSVYSTPL